MGEVCFVYMFKFWGMGVVALMIIVHEKNEIERIVLNVMSFKSSWQYVKSDQSDI